MVLRGVRGADAKECDMDEVATAMFRQRQVSMGEAWRYFWTRWTFRGRASRSEYWWASFAIWLVAFAVGTVLPLALAPMAGEGGVIAMGVVYVLFSLAVAVPGWTLMVRRLHDVGLSGWWLLIGVVPVVGMIVLLVFFVLPSRPAPNRFGPVPNVVP